MEEESYAIILLWLAYSLSMSLRFSQIVAYIRISFLLKTEEQSQACWCTPVIPAHRRLRQKKVTLKASLGYTARPCPLHSSTPIHTHLQAYISIHTHTHIHTLYMCTYTYIPMNECVYKYILHTLYRVFYLCVCCASVSEYTHSHIGARRGQKGVLDVLLEFQVIMSCLTWMLGTEFRASAISP